MGLALVTRIPSLSEAQIAAGVLRSAGIEAGVFDAGFGAMESPVIEGLGGYRLMAPAQDVAAARDFLKSVKANPIPLDPDDSGPWTSRPGRARGRGMRWLALLILAGPFLLWLIARVVNGLAASGDTP